MPAKAGIEYSAASLVHADARAPMTELAIRSKQMRYGVSISPGREARMTGRGMRRRRDAYRRESNTTLSRRSAAYSSNFKNPC
jgi:hypothetical protein